MTLAVDVVDDPDRAQAMLHPTRLALLEQLREPASATVLAQRVAAPRQRINYHLQELLKRALIEVVEERRRGSVVERVYRRTGDSYAISTAALGRLGVQPDAVQDRFSSAFQVALASRAVRELGALQAGAQAVGKALPTFALETEVRFASPVARSAFAQELTEMVAALVEKHHDATAEDGRAYRFYLGGYPKPKPEAPR